MKTNYQLRYAAHPEDAKSYDTQRLRNDFLIEKVFSAEEVNMVYSMYDRMIVGGAMPVNESLHLEAIDPLKQPVFLRNRELGIFNVGGKGKVKVGETIFDLNYKEALYIGSGDRELYFESDDAGELHVLELPKFQENQIDTKEKAWINYLKHGDFIEEKLKEYEKIEKLNYCLNQYWKNEKI